MRFPLLLSLSASLAAPASAGTFDAPAEYITPGQDEPGYRAWYLARPERRQLVAGFNHYLVEWGAGGVVPTWQLLRTATDWAKCAGQPFEVPPASHWPNIVQTLRFVRDAVVPAVGPVEAVSGYRNPELNACAHGSPRSAHLGYYALDLVPLKQTSREDLLRTVCTAHFRRGGEYGAGLGFYIGLRFHVDSNGFRTWGRPGQESPCLAIQQELKAAETAEALAN